MKRNINILDEPTINKIAAGEVVEKPVSVIKELMENSIDAGADRIIVEIQNGGKSFIRITDNGCGIHSKEAEKAFLRHATSKIKSIEDLYRTLSLGFRGEALSSITSVSKMQIVTKTEEEKAGTKLVYESGKLVLKESVGTVNGTTIIVEDLFYNVPARKKFLNSDRSETLKISDIINKFSIGYPHIKFEYVNNKKEVFTSPGDGSITNAIRAVHGKDISQNLIKVDINVQSMKVSGYVSNTSVYRNNKSLQYIYINGRTVQNKTLSNSIKDAYKSLIPINKHPLCFLSISIDPKCVDVNIHPAKLEVKFENESTIYKELKNELREILLSTDIVPKYNLANEMTSKDIGSNKEIKSSVDSAKSILDDFSEENLEISIQTKNKCFKDTPDMGEKSYQAKRPPYKRLAGSSKLPNNNSVDKKNEKNASFKKIEIRQDTVPDDSTSPEELPPAGFVGESQTSFDEYDGFKDASSSGMRGGCPKEQPRKNSIDRFRTIGTLFDTYIIAQFEKSMFMVDQHAAHERIMFEKYISDFENSEISSQMLLSPMIINLSITDMAKVEENMEFFKKFGFGIESYGMNSIIVRSVPNMLGQPESEKFIYEIIDEIDSKEKAHEFKIDKIASRACKSAIKARDALKQMEIEQLLSDLSLCENPFTCPHGRPVVIELTEKEIEKMFKRIV